ncbi:hypothetical protein PTKIN_Ptkin03bG0094400 [Pterospermum kingtungense]
MMLDGSPIFNLDSGRKSQGDDGSMDMVQETPLLVHSIVNQTTHGNPIPRVSSRDTLVGVGQDGDSAGFDEDKMVSDDEDLCDDEDDEDCSTIKLSKRIEYEGIHLVCFQCGLYGHQHDSCLSGDVLGNQEKGVTETLGKAQGDDVRDDGGESNKEEEKN